MPHTPVTRTAAWESLHSSSQPSRPPGQSPDKPPRHVLRPYQHVPPAVPNACEPWGDPSPLARAQGHAGLAPGGGLRCPHATAASCYLHTPRHPPPVNLRTGGTLAAPCPPIMSGARQRRCPASAQHQLPQPGHRCHRQTESGLPAPKEPRLQPRRTPPQGRPGLATSDGARACRARSTGRY